VSDGTTILHLVLTQGAAQPAHEAVTDGSRALSYAALVDETAKIAAALAARGVAAGDRVALCLPNSIEFLEAALACLWIGAIFVPVSMADPTNRLTAIYESCDPVLRLTESSEQWSPSRWPGVSVALLREEAKEPVPISATPDAPSYCIYTSGTTGSPKGVLVSGIAFSAAIEAATTGMAIGSSTRALCVSPFHFDGSFGTLFTVPTVGGTLVIPRREAVALPRMFFRLLVGAQITHTSFSPSYLRLLLHSSDRERFAASCLRTLGLGGEALHREDLERLWAIVPELRIFNRYGPTETTIAVTTTELARESIGSRAAVPIGTPHPRVSFVLVDSADRIIEGVNEIGELYIGGIQLMTGYLGDDALTASVLRTDLVEGTTLYRTGDLALRNVAGQFVCVGRSDSVVKRSGVRISLEEVSAGLRRLKDVLEAACVAFARDDELGIAAFVVTASRAATPEALLHAALNELPVTMLPDMLKVIEEIPLGASGKLDERALLLASGLAPLTSCRPRPNVPS